MKLKGRTVILILCALLLAAATVFGTLAYLTDDESIVNTFSVGSVELKLDEAKVNTSGGGASLMKEDAIEKLTGMIFPLATLVTPNIPEAETLTGMQIHNKADMEKAAGRISDTYQCSVLLKGGHSVCDADDLLCSKHTIRWFAGRRIENTNTHGTGCTLSSAIAANLAIGHSLEESVGKAKEYICGALAANLDLGKGAGPLLHNYELFRP